MRSLAKALLICLLVAGCILALSFFPNAEHTDGVYLAQSDDTDSGETESEDAAAEDADGEDSEEESSVWDDCVEYLEDRLNPRLGATGGAVRG